MVRHRYLSKKGEPKGPDAGLQPTLGENLRQGKVYATLQPFYTPDSCHIARLPNYDYTITNCPPLLLMVDDAS